MAQQSPHPSIYYGSTKPATDVQLEKIIHYLCDSGPGYCKRCPSQCAYGKRFLREYAGLGFSDALIDYVIESNKHPQPYMYTIRSTVLELTGYPACSFEQWAQEHATDFI